MNAAVVLTTENSSLEINISDFDVGSGKNASKEIYMSKWVALAIFYVPVVLIGVVANPLVITAFVICKPIRTISNAFVVDLSVADVNVVVFGGLTTLSEMYFVANDEDGELEKKNVWCHISSNLVSVSVMASFLIILVITVHRYVRIARSNERYLWFFDGERKVKMWCALPWLLALMSSLHYHAVYLVPSFACHATPSRVVACSVIFFVVYVVCIVLNYLSFRRLKGLRMKAGIYSSEKKKTQLLKKSRKLRTSLIVNTICIHLYIPYHVFLMWVELDPPPDLSSPLAVCLGLSKWILVFNCSSSSLVNGAINTSFKRKSDNTAVSESELSKSNVSVMMTPIEKHFSTIIRRLSRTPKESTFRRDPSAAIMTTDPHRLQITSAHTQRSSRQGSFQEVCNIQPSDVLLKFRRSDPDLDQAEEKELVDNVTPSKSENTEDECPVLPSKGVDTEHPKKEHPTNEQSLIIAGRNDSTSFLIETDDLSPLIKLMSGQTDMNQDITEHTRPDCEEQKLPDSCRLSPPQSSQNLKDKSSSTDSTIVGQNEKTLSPSKDAQQVSKTVTNGGTSPKPSPSDKPIVNLSNKFSTS